MAAATTQQWLQQRTTTSERAAALGGGRPVSSLGARRSRLQGRIRASLLAVAGGGDAGGGAKMQHGCSSAGELGGIAGHLRLGMVRPRIQAEEGHRRLQVREAAGRLKTDAGGAGAQARWRATGAGHGLACAGCWRASDRAEEQQRGFGGVFSGGWSREIGDATSGFSCPSPPRHGGGAEVGRRGRRL
ncbi:hypothetical protein J5N97_026033 [Dioscorea zingiberensis]|uniref:Uncharacterized protein n=1 Tax=Dioscorea zingiberensis TaxID=325984 RepID=A0A9D5C1N7_9LILI|nr:hypothetical protein J5N97_026033 [Dioscorea zingiberensis]